MADTFDPDAFLQSAAPKAAPQGGGFDPDAFLAGTQRIAFTPGQKQYADDEALLAKYQGVVPDAAKAAGWSAANTALLYAPRAATALYSSYAKNKPYEQALKEQTQYEEALTRQHPTASMIGTGAGLVGGLAVPLGPLATAGKAAGAATAAKLGTTAGKMAEGATIGSVLSGTSGLLESGDPREAVKSAALGMGLGAAAAPAVNALGNYFSKLPSIQDKSGNLTGEAMSAVRKAFPQMSDADINSFKDQIVQSMSKTGPTEAGAREALLAKEGVTPTKSIVEGKTAPEAAKDIREQSLANAQTQLEATAGKLIGKESGRTDVARALGEVVGREVPAASERYETLKTMAGKGAPEIQDTYMPYMQKALQDANLPTSFENSKMFPQATAAMKWMQKGPMVGNYTFSGEKLTPKNILYTLKEFNAIRAGASGDDYQAVNAMKKGFIQSISDHIVQPALFDGDGPMVIKALKDAEAGWADMKSTLFPDKGPASSAFRSTVQNFVDSATNKIATNPTQGMIDAAQGALNSNLISPKVGSAYYERLEKALGANSPAMDTVNQHIKALALNTDGDISKLPKKIDTLLNDTPTIAQKVFSDNERQDLRRLADAIRVVNQKPISDQEKTSMLVGAFKQLTKYTTSGILGYLFGDLPGAIKGIAAAKAAETVTGPLSTAVARSAESAGAAGPSIGEKAPSYFRFLNQPLSDEMIARLIPRNVPAMAPVGVPGYQEPTTLPPLTIHRNPVARASGGRVAAKLMADVERAKKDVNNRTQALLNVDDNHVARALEIANQNVEG